MSLHGQRKKIYYQKEWEWNSVQIFSAINYNPPCPKTETVDCHFSLEHAEMSIVNQQHCSSFNLPKAHTNGPKDLKKNIENLMKIVFYFAMRDWAEKEFSFECELQKKNWENIEKTYQNKISFKNLLKYMFFQRKIIPANSLHNNRWEHIQKVYRI